MDNNDMSDTFIKEVGQKSAFSSGNTEVVPVEDIQQAVGSSDQSNQISMDKEEIKEEKVVGNNNKTEEEKPKKKRSFGGLLFILGLILGAGASYFVLTYILPKEEPAKKVVTKKEVTSKSFNAEGQFIKNIINKYDSFKNDDVAYKALYSNDKTDIDNLDKDYIKYIAARNVSLNTTLSGFTSEDLHNSVIELFGSEVTIDDGNILLPFSNNKEVLYQYDNSMYTTKNVVIGNKENVTFYRKIVKAFQEKNKLEVNVAVGIFDNNADKVYKSIDKDGKFIDEASGITVSSFEDDDYTNLNQYKYTFDYDSSTDNYILKSIELIK